MTINSSKNKNRDIKNNIEKNNLELKIRNYLMNDAFITEEYQNDDCDIGFNIKFPKIKNKSGDQLGYPIAIIKLKKNDYIEIFFTIKFGEKDFEIIKKLDDNLKTQIRNELRNVALFRNLFFNIKLENNDITIKDKLYLDGDKIPTINKFYRSLRNILNSQIIILDILNARFPKLQEFDKDNLGSSEMFR